MKKLLEGKTILPPLTSTLVHVGHLEVVAGNDAITDPIVEPVAVQILTWTPTLPVLKPKWAVLRKTGYFPEPGMKRVPGWYVPPKLVVAL
jgi:hypothetical protein